MVIYTTEIIPHYHSNHKYYDYQSSRAPQKFSHQILNRKVALLSLASGSVSSGDLSAFDITGRGTHEIVGNMTGDAQLLIMLPMWDGGKLPVTTLSYLGKTLPTNLCHGLCN